MCSKLQAVVQLLPAVPSLLDTHCSSKFDRYGIRLLRHLTAHAKAYLGHFAGCWWDPWGLILVFSCEMLGCAFDCCPFSSHSATRDRLSFHSAFLLLRPCLRQDNSPRWTTVSCELDNNKNPSIITFTCMANVTFLSINEPNVILVLFCHSTYC